jgi:thiol-disulfide isomerase/thioredoxin
MTSGKRRNPPGRLLAVSAVLAAVLGGVAAVSACSGPSAGQGNGYVDGEGTVNVVAAADRSAVPDIKATTLAGKPFDLAAYRGKVVVLNFWASWCPPCRVETPALQYVAAELAAKGVVFVGVDTRETDLDAANAFLRDVARQGLPYLNIADPDGSVALAFSGSLPPNAIPSTLVIDRRGRLAVRIVGPTTQPRIEALLSPLIAEKT